MPAGRSLSPPTGGTPASCLPTTPPTPKSVPPRERRLGWTKPPRSSPNPSLHPLTKSRLSRFVDCFSRTRCNAAPQGSFGVPSISASVWWFFKSVRRWVPPWVGPTQSVFPTISLGGSSTPTSSPSCVMTVIAMAFRFSALHIEKSEPTATYRRLTLRRALLLYRFKRPAAAIARTVFWFWAALTILLAMAIVLSVFDDPRLIPANLVELVAFVGWAVGLRYWAVSLNDRTASTTTAASPGG